MGAAVVQNGLKVGQLMVLMPNLRPVLHMGEESPLISLLGSEFMRFPLYK